MMNTIEGRYITRNGMIVAVHGEKGGHLIKVIDTVKRLGVADSDILLYNLVGNCATSSELDLMTAIDRGASPLRLTVTGCSECEKQNGGF